MTYKYSGCANLTSVNIENPKTEIDENAFRGCTQIDSKIIPQWMTEPDDTPMW